MCKEKFINPFTDFGFKKLFGTAANKEFLISFLNSLFEAKDRIVDITYRNVEQLGMRPDNRNAVFDLYCTTESEDHIIVEVQNGYQRYFIDRSVYYSSFPMQEAAKKGDWDFNLPKIYTVAFLNFNMSEHVTDPHFKHVVRLTDEATGKVFYDKLTYIYLEMKKYDRVPDLDAIGSLDDSASPQAVFDVWLYIIKHLDKFDAIPRQLRNGIFERFFREAEIQAYTPEERMAYEQSLKAYRDYNNTISSAEYRGEMRGIEKGRAEGKAEGRAEGRVEGKAEGRAEGKAEGKLEASIEMALILSKLGVDINAIAQASHLTIDQIRELTSKAETND